MYNKKLIQEIARKKPTEQQFLSGILELNIDIQILNIQKQSLCQILKK